MDRVIKGKDHFYSSWLASAAIGPVRAFVLRWWCVRCGTQLTYVCRAPAYVRQRHCACQAAALAQGHSSPTSCHLAAATTKKPTTLRRTTARRNSASHQLPGEWPMWSAPPWRWWQRVVWVQSCCPRWKPYAPAAFHSTNERAPLTRSAISPCRRSRSAWLRSLMSMVLSAPSEYACRAVCVCVCVCVCVVRACAWCARVPCVCAESWC